MTINTITEHILELSRKLEKGELHADEIMEMTELTRQLHERMIVLQYKTFEGSIKHDEENKSEQEGLASANVGAEERAPEIAEPEPREPEPETENLETKKEGKTEVEEYPKKEAPITEASEERAEFRIDNSIIPSNQISLIDSIEEIKEMEKSLNDAFSDSTPSLSQKLNKKPITNLKSSITINQKFKFISSLFNNDTAAFEEAVDRINSCATYLEADEYIQNSLSDRYEWEMKSTPVKEMLELVERRFL